MSELEELRKQIDQADAEILGGFKKRLEVCRKIAEYKKENGLPVFDAEREKQVIQNRRAALDLPQTEELFDCIMKICRNYQHSVSEDEK